MARLIDDSMRKMAVDHNGLIVPGRLVEDMFSTYCVPLGFWTGDAQWPVCIPGSATLIKYRGRYFMACTRHQLAALGSSEDICILLDAGPGQTRCITSSGTISFDDKMNDGDHNDIALFDFTEPAMAEPDLKPIFLDFRGQHHDVPSEEVIGLIAYGYPFEGRDIDYEGGNLALLKQKVVCRYHGQGADDAVHIIRPRVPLTFSPDGMSGGPAFAIVVENYAFSIHLAGINVRGSKELIRVVKAGAIQMMMDRFIDLRPKPGIDA